MSKHGLPLRYEYPGYCCPFCGEAVGYVGRFFAWLFGTSFHGCDFSNVKRRRSEHFKDTEKETK